MTSFQKIASMKSYIMLTKTPKIIDLEKISIILIDFFETTGVCIINGLCDQAICIVHLQLKYFP